MVWCWQQDPDMRPTATQVVEVAKSEQFCRLVDGIRIDNDGRVLCVCHREISITLRQKTRDLRKRHATADFVELTASLDKRERSVSTREGHSTSIPHQDFEQLYASSLYPTDSAATAAADDVSYSSSTLERKVDVVRTHEVWVSSSDVHCSRVTVLDYCGRFTGVQVGAYIVYKLCSTTQPPNA